MRLFIPSFISSCSKDVLIQRYGYSNALASRLFNKKCLWLIVMPMAYIHRIHEADLYSKYNHQSQNLDIIEYTAIYAAVPVAFNNDGSGKKAKWRASLEESVKAMHKQLQAGNLAESKKRNPAYKDQMGKFDYDQEHVSHFEFSMEASDGERRNSKVDQVADMDASGSKGSEATVTEEQVPRGSPRREVAMLAPAPPPIRKERGSARVSGLEHTSILQPPSEEESMNSDFKNKRNAIADLFLNRNKI